MAIERIIMAGEGGIPSEAISSAASAEPKVVVRSEVRPPGVLSRLFRRGPNSQMEVLVKPGESAPKVGILSSEYDPAKIEQYTPKIEGMHVVYSDPDTGKEVARIPRIAGGASLSPEAEKLLEKAKEREADPQYWMSSFLDLHNLPKAEREARKDEYAQVCRRLAVFAHDKKIFGNSPEVTIIEEQLTDLEKREIETGTRTEEEKEQLQDLLDFFSAQQRELIRVRNSLDLKKKDPKIFTKTKWDELADREKELIVEIDTLKTEVTSKVSSDFLKNREKLIAKIAEATTQAKFDENEKNLKQLRELQDKPDQAEIDLEKGLLEDKLITERPPNTPKLPELLTRLHNLEERRKEGALGFDEIQLAKDRISLAWYLQEARRLGVLSDLEERLDKDYHRFVELLSPHVEVDAESGRRRVVSGKVFSEVQDEIIESLESLLDKTKVQYVERGRSWELHRRDGVSQVDIKQLQGIREEFVRRAFPQMEDSLFNMSKGRAGFRTNRIPGEWNVYKLEKSIREEKEGQQARERTAPLFRHEHYYTIDLIGRNREEVERGADQAADYIIRSATTFSLEVVRQRMELLTQGIERTKGIIESEVGSEEEAKKIVLEIQRAITNKLDFFILDWLSGNLLMDQFASYYSDRLRQDGDQKLKAIPAMNDGQTGLAIHWLLNPMYNLYHRPQGFKGQLYDDDQTHRYMRVLMGKQIIKKLMEYELKGSRSKLKDGPTLDEYLQQFDRKGVIPTGIIPADMIPVDAEGEKIRFFQDLSKEDNSKLLNHLSAFFESLDLQTQKALLETLTPDQRVKIRSLQYNRVLGTVKGKTTVTSEDLVMVREVRKRLAEEQNYRQAIKGKAESAFITADRVLNIFGESAFLNAPSIVMENGPEIKTKDGEIIKRGDFMSIFDIAQVYKYAILSADQGVITESNGTKYKIRVNNIQDNLALIRSRAQAWIRKAKRNGYDRSKTNRDVVIDLPGDQKAIVKLAAGFEETGLTEAQLQALKDADQKLREKGYQAVINGVKFEGILKMDELQPVLNNFLADYKSSMSEINEPLVIEQAARGRFPSIANIRKRLGFKGLERVQGTTQQAIDEYTQRAEDTRSFDAEVERLVYFLATHDLNKPLKTKADQPITERGKPLYEFSANRVDYGYQRSWGVKRLHHLKAFWYTNLRRTVPRGVDLIHALPFTLTALSREMAFDNFLQMCWEVDKMESIDNPSLVMMGERHKSLVYLRSKGEGTISEGQGGLDKAWGWFEKWLVDANGLWKEIKGAGITIDALMRKLKDVDNPKLESDPIGSNEAEELVDAIMKALGRFQPLLAGTEKLLGEERQALSAGSGYEENEKIIFRFSEWLLSSKGGDAREQGGSIVQKEIKDILRLLATPGTFTPGRVYQGEPEGNKNVILSESPSILEEAMRKLTTSHNPRLPLRVPSPSYELLLAA